MEAESQAPYPQPTCSLVLHSQCPLCGWPLSVTAADTENWPGPASEGSCTNRGLVCGTLRENKNCKNVLIFFNEEPFKSPDFLYNELNYED